ncbi:MAG: helix-turn-helix transcriptional regulator [Solirubrobacterales bacterium]|nr:helix-turn-helix transcriptional regulator [Solirubrobacterales bacterium]
MATDQTTPAQARSGCCPYYHDAIELIGRRWTGAILAVLMDADRPLRFSEIAASVPQLSDRLLSERVKELEARGLLAREATVEAPVRVDYALTPMGRSLAPALAELATWARRWLGDSCTATQDPDRPSG